MAHRPICDVDTPDPWMIAVEGAFYLTFTLGDRIEIWRSLTMDDFRSATKTLVWKPQPGAPWSDAIWAPELHYLNNTWYIYSAAAHPGKGNVSHRTIILRSSSQDPMDGRAWQFLGPLSGLPDHWHIDATVFSPRPNELYCCYSGWPLGDFSDTEQVLFLVKMIDPEHALADSLVVISRPELDWERPEGGRRGVNEGMSWVQTPSFRGLVFSANGSWTCDYRLGVLQLVGQDPLQASSWKKRSTPLLTSVVGHNGPFGPGHASFIQSPHDETVMFCVYHGTERADEGWANRKARILAMSAEHFHPSAQPICCSQASSKRQSLIQAEPGQSGTTLSPASSLRLKSVGRRLKDGLLKRLT